MRKREVKKNFYLSYKEDEILKKKAYLVGLTESELVRCLITGFVPKEKPGKEFYEEIKSLRQIGNNLNQLARYTNTTGLLKTSELMKTKEMIELFIFNLEKKYLTKEESKIIISPQESE